MKARDVMLILGTMVLPYAIAPLQGNPQYSSDLCCSETAECPDGLVCRAPATGEECSLESPGYCGLLGSGGLTPVR
jgi:hypothetical protein